MSRQNVLLKLVSLICEGATQSRGSNLQSPLFLAESPVGGRILPEAFTSNMLPALRDIRSCKRFRLQGTRFGMSGSSSPLMSLCEAATTLSEMATRRLSDTLLTGPFEVACSPRPVFRIRLRRQYPVPDWVAASGALFPTSLCRSDAERIFRVDVRTTERLEVGRRALGLTLTEDERGSDLGARESPRMRDLFVLANFFRRQVEKPTGLTIGSSKFEGRGFCRKISRHAVARLVQTQTCFCGQKSDGVVRHDRRKLRAAEGMGKGRSEVV